MIWIHYGRAAGLQGVRYRLRYGGLAAQQRTWLRLADEIVIDHKAGNATSNTFEVQVGKMLSSRFGVYMDALYRTGGYRAGRVSGRPVCDGAISER